MMWSLIPLSDNEAGNITTFSLVFLQLATGPFSMNVFYDENSPFILDLHEISDHHQNLIRKSLPRLQPGNKIPLQPVSNFP